MNPTPNFVYHVPNLPSFTPELSCLPEQNAEYCFVYCDLIKSNNIQKGRVQAVRNMMFYTNVMEERQEFYTGKKRIVSERDFNLIMSQIKKIISNLLKRISNPSSLTHLAKQTIHLHPFIPIHELPIHLQNEVSNICQDTVAEEEEIIYVINVELEKTKSLYNEAFSCNTQSCIML